MTYVFVIRINGGAPRTYRIDARSEEEAHSRLALRLPPSDRDNFVIDSLQIDMSTVGVEEPYGSFG